MHAVQRPGVPPRSSPLPSSPPSPTSTRSVAALGGGAPGNAVPAPKGEANLPKGERRQVTVLFADLSNFTGLSESLDMEETHALLNRYFSAVDGLVENYGGSIDKHIGDGVMAVFGAPIAHSNDPERAVRAAFDIQAAVAALEAPGAEPLSCHIGLASGQVVASGTGSAAHQEYTIIGDSVNLASRLQDLAGAGEIAASETVRDAVGALVSGEKIEQVNIKGIAQPVTVWRLTELIRQSGASSRTPCVGRRVEIAQFQGALDACAEAGQGQSVLLRGDAGIGKTRLMEEFRDMAERSGFAVHMGQVLDFGARVGADAIHMALLSMLGCAADAPEAERLAGAEAAVGENWLADADRVFLYRLLNLALPESLRGAYDAMDNDLRVSGQQRCVADIMRARSAVRPLMLLIEDVHWAEREVLGHLAALAQTAGACPAILVMTSRIEGDPLDRAWRAACAGAPLTTIDLGPLRPDEAEEMVARVLGGGADDSGEDDGFIGQCIARAEGNPLFLEQLLHMAEASIGEAVPGSIQSLVQARMDSLSDGERLALQAAAVLGQQFSLAALRHLLDDANFSCGELVDKFMLRPAGSDWMFAHALIRDGVYNALLREEKRALHARAAIWFEQRDAVLLAGHLERAEDPGAAAAFLAAARTEAEKHRHDAAADLAQRGAALPAAADIAFELHWLNGDMLRNVGGVSEAIEAFERAQEIAAEDRMRCRAWLGLADCMRLVDRYDDALAALDAAQTLAEKNEMTAELSAIHFRRANICFPLGRIEECLAEHEAAHRLGHEAGLRDAEARALGGLGDAYYQRGHMRTAQNYFQRCIDLCRENGFEEIEAANLNMLANTRAYLLQTEQSGRDYAEAVELTERLGQRRPHVIGLMGCFTKLNLGDGAGALDDIDKALAIVERIGAHRFEAWCLAFKARILAREGKRAEALRLAERAIAICRETGITFAGPLSLGIFALLCGDADKRQAAFDEAEAVLAGGCVSHNYFWFYRDAIEASLNAAEWAEAERFADALEEYTRAEPIEWSDFYIGWARALAAWGRGARDSEAELRRLLALAEEARFGIAVPALEKALAEI